VIIGVTANDVVHLLQLEPLPVEGGWFRETCRSEEQVPAGVLRANGARNLATAIYYLLTPETFSAMHRLASDEVYHFYLGDPVELLTLALDGSSERVVLGHDLGHGQTVQFLVPRRTWQGSRLLPGGTFALLGTTMSPGFSPEDFELGQREELMRLCPEQAELIRALTY
jgi:hypothetical protein